MRVLPLALALLALASANPASANPFHERLARLSDGERNAVFTEHMGKTPEPCTVTRSFFQGFTDARAAVWSVACTSKKSYAIMVGDDATGSTRFVDCEKLKAATQGKRECFRKY